MSTSSERRRTAQWPTRPRQGEPSDPSAALAKAQKEIRELKAAAKAAAARPSGAAPKDSTLAAGPGAKGGGKGAASKICFHFRDHGSCPKGDSCPFSHDKELRKQALAAKRGESTLAAKGGKGGGKGGGKAGAAPKAKPKAKPKAAAKAAPKPPARRRARAGRERTVTWCTACWPGRVKPCRPTGALPRERP